MARLKQPRYRNSTTGVPAVKIIALLACLGTVGAAAIFIVNGKIDLGKLTVGLKSPAKDEDSTTEEKDEQDAIGIASLESPSTEEATEDHTGESKAGETKTASATNPFEEAEVAPPPAKPAAKKHHKHLAQHEEQPAQEAADWEQAAAHPQKSPPKSLAGKHSSSKSQPPGIAELEADMTPPDAPSLDEESPRTLPKAEPKRLKRLPAHQQPERKSASRQSDAELQTENAENQLIGQAQLQTPQGADPQNPQRNQLNENQIAEFQTENDDSAAFRRIQRVKDERVATKPESDSEPALETLELESTAVTAPDTDIDLAKTRKLTTEGEEKQAHRLLSEWYWKYPTKRAVLQKDLDELAQRIYFSPQPYYGEPYEIQAGDQLARIAKQYNLSWQYLARLNQVQPKKLRAGKKLKVFQGPFLACVDLSDFELTIHQNGLFIKKYKVGIGKENSSPIGEFVVKEKLENPTYYGPDGDVKDANDPLNPLGERWIDIGNSFGIHGTIEPDTVGKSASRGCIRMLNSDIEEVYDLLTAGSRVRIQR